MSRYVTFTIDRVLYGIDVIQVQEALQAQTRTRVPLAPDAIAGLVNLRGQVVLTVDLRRRIGVQPAPDDAERMMVVVQIDDEPTSLLVDTIGDVVDVGPDRFGPPPDTLDPALRSLVEGAYQLDERLLLVLDVREAVTVA